jgi:5'-methylthioadenosine phosphorylase
MTLASEATLASELTMEFSAVCTVDNFANGIASLEVTYEQLLETSKLNRERTDEIMNAIITHMA